MKIIFKAFSKKLFGAKYERLTRTIFIYLVMFWGLFIADFQIQISPFILYLMVSTFTAGVMWQALSSEDNAAYMQNMIMLPFKGREFVLSYIAAMGAYTFLTKTMGSAGTCTVRVRMELDRNFRQYPLCRQCNPYDLRYFFIEKVLAHGNFVDCCWSLLSSSFRGITHGFFSCS